MNLLRSSLPLRSRPRYRRWKAALHLAIALVFSNDCGYCSVHRRQLRRLWGYSKELPPWEVRRSFFSFFSWLPEEAQRLTKQLAIQFARWDWKLPWRVVSDSKAKLKQPLVRTNTFLFAQNQNVHHIKRVIIVHKHWKFNKTCHRLSIFCVTHVEKCAILGTSTALRNCLAHQCSLIYVSSISQIIVSHPESSSADVPTHKFDLARLTSRGIAWTANH